MAEDGEKAEGTRLDDHVAEIIGRNVDSIHSLHVRAEQGTKKDQRLLERLTLLIGRPAGLYAALLVVAAWITFNGLSGTPFDAPPFSWLQGLITLAAFLTTLMVLARQNRQQHQATKQAHLELQVNLLTEQKIAKLIGLIEELRRDLPNVRDRDDPVARTMAQASDPHAVMMALDQTSIGSIGNSH